MPLHFMTPTKYFLARIGLAFGIQRRNLRMADAASETHLLRDAELHLGLALWEKCENIEELSVEYWNMRKLVGEHAEKEKRVAECKSRLDAAYEERAQLLLGDGSDDVDQQEQRAKLLTRLDDLAIRRDEVIDHARRLRRTFDGLKTKLEVLQQSGASDEEIQNCKLRLRDIKNQFDGLKIERTAIGDEIGEKEAELAEIEREINEAGKSRRGGASQAFQVLGVTNQELAALNAEIGLLKKRQLELCAEIGRYLSRNLATNPSCATICKHHRGLIDIMAALRRSITYNHRIAGV